MVVYQDRKKVSSGDDLQDVVVPGVSGSGVGPGANADRVWLLTTDGVRVIVVHNLHVRAGRKRVGGCGICREDVEAVLVPVPQEVPGDEEDALVQDSGANEGWTASFAYDPVDGKEDEEG